jgi:CheY-like chemotaxis protein
MATVMVVDDTEVCRDTLARLLRREGYEAVTAGGGNEALHLLKKHLPDLIVLDVEMPGLDGLDLLEMLHDEPQWSGVPVVMLTGCCDTHCVERAGRLGAKRYLLKASFSVREMMQCVRQYAGTPLH